MLAFINLAEWYWFLAGVLLVDIPLTVVTIWIYNNKAWTKTKGLMKSLIRWRRSKDEPEESEEEMRLRQMTQSLVGDNEGVYYALVVQDENDYIRGLCCVLLADNLSDAKLEADLRFDRIRDVWDENFALSHTVWRIGDE